MGYQFRSQDFLNNENWSISDCDAYKSVCYLENRKCKLMSPFTTIHQVSPINEYKPVELDKFYFEIHPITCAERNESYLVKVLYNNEEVLNYQSSLFHHRDENEFHLLYYSQMLVHRKYYPLN